MPAKRKTVTAILLVGLAALSIGILVHHATTRTGGLHNPELEKLVGDKPLTLKVYVDNLKEGEEIPPAYTCIGRNHPVRVVIEEIPGPGSIVLIMYDPDAPHGPFIHWLAIKEVTGREEKVVFPGPGEIYGVNSAGKLGYFGPCPPPGEVHHYIFLVLYTRSPPELHEGFTYSQLLGLLQTKGVDAWGYSMHPFRR